MTGRRARIGIGALCALVLAIALGTSGAGAAGVAPKAAGTPTAYAGALIELVTTPLQRGERAQIAASAIGVKQCALSFSGPDGKRSGPFGVKLSVRAIQWSWLVPEDATGGHWLASVACKGAAATTTRLTLDAKTTAYGPIVQAGTVDVAPLTSASQYDGGKGGGTSCDPGVLDLRSGYCTGYCTDFVWSLRPELDHLGDASKWWAEQKSLKGKVPALDAVAWWRARSPGRPFGHVAYVVGVGAGTVTVREMNHGRGHWNVEDTRTIDLQGQEAPDGYIYADAAPKPLLPPVVTVTTPAETVTTPPVTVAIPSLTVTSPPLTVTTKAQPDVAANPPAVLTHEIVGPRPLDAYADPGVSKASGAQIAAGATVDVVCRYALPASIDPATSPDGVWYRLWSAPWNDEYAALASGFLNGQPAGTTTPTTADSAVPVCPDTVQPAPAITPGASPSVTGPKSPVTVSPSPQVLVAGPFGTLLYRFQGSMASKARHVGPFAMVDVSCKEIRFSPSTRWVTTYGFWYRLVGQKGRQLYAPADAFLNGDRPLGPYRTHVSTRVPNCR